MENAGLDFDSWIKLGTTTTNDNDTKKVSVGDLLVAAEKLRELSEFMAEMSTFVIDGIRSDVRADIRSNSMLEQVHVDTPIPTMNTSLADMARDHITRASEKRHDFVEKAEAISALANEIEFILGKVKFKEKT